MDYLGVFLNIIFNLFYSNKSISEDYYLIIS